MTSQTPSTPSQEDDPRENTELGLSLGIQPSTRQEEIRDEDHNKEESKELDAARFAQSKLHRSEMAGVTNVASPPNNRKARVSVRARCQTATVSSLIQSFLTLSMKFYSSFI